MECCPHKPGKLFLPAALCRKVARMCMAKLNGLTAALDPTHLLGPCFIPWHWLLWDEAAVARQWGRAHKGLEVMITAWG